MNKVTTSLENTEMSENLTNFTLMSGNWPEVGELWEEKSCREKVFIVNFVFRAMLVFSIIVRTYLSYWVTTPWVEVPQRVGEYWRISR